MTLALFFLATIPFALTSQAAAQVTEADQLSLVPITLQLRWLHQFQFAGYYAAKEKGFYREAGFDVTIVAGAPGRAPINEVLAGRAQFGVANSELLFRRLEGQPLVALAAIFQHSAMILLAKKDSDIRSPQDLRGRKVMSTGDAEIIAMVRSEGIDPDEVDFRESSFEIGDLVEGRTDAFNAYLTNEPYFMKQLNIPYVTLKPSTYGIDFYSDILFTIEKEIRNRPDQVKRFREASLRGWRYAMQNPDEIIDLIRSKYRSTKTREHLQFEADVMRQLVLPDGVELGHMNPGRWKHMADTFVREGMIDPGYSLQGFIYDPDAPADVIVFLGDKNFAPYEFIENEKPAGANVDFLVALGGVLGRPVEVRLYQWAETQARFNNGEGHALTLANINEKRKKIYEFTQSTFNIEFALFVKSEQLGRFSIQDLSNKRIAVKKGGYPQTIIENSHPEARMVFVESFSEGVRLLSQGEVDAVVEERLVAHNFLTENNVHQGIESIEEPLATRSAHIPVIRGNTALLKEFNQAISKLKSTGEIQKIARRWLGGPILFITRTERDAGLIGAAVTLAFVGVLAALLLTIVMKRNRERSMVEGQMRASLAEKEVLLSEIHHRVKNNLQVVSSMLSLQAGAETGSRSIDALEEAQRRVKVMARIHETLYKSEDLASIEAKDYLNTILEDTIASSGRGAQGISYRLDADPIIFNVDTAIACGQIVSELLSNSLKHAFHRDQSGNIEVLLHRRDGGKIELSVADDGKGLPENFEQAQVETLGIRLVQTLTKQLGGEVSIGGSVGTCVQVTFREDKP